MNLSTVIVILIIAAAVLLAVRQIYRSGKNGGSCAGCPNAGSCSRNRGSCRGSVSNGRTEKR